MTEKPKVQPSLTRADPAIEVASLEAAAQTPGRMLYQARERLEMSVQDLAARARLPKSVIEALERDDFAHLNEPVYVRGYYRKCAGILGVPEDQLAAAYQRIAAVKPVSAPSKPLLLADDELESSPRRRRGGHGGGGWRRVWATLVFIVIVLGVVFWYLHSRMQSLSLPTPNLGGAAHGTAAGAAPAKVGDGIALSQDAINVLATPSTAAPPPASSAAQATKPMAGKSAASTVSAAPGAEASSPASSASVAGAASAQSADALKLTFKQASWVRIEDADGKILLSGLMQAGQRQAVDGKPPYSVFLGNASGVGIEYRKHSFDLKPYIKPNSTARFSVPQSQ